MPRSMSLPILLGLLATLSACKTLGELRDQKTLQKTLDRYGAALRWGEWRSLAELRAPDARPMPRLDFDNIRVTGYEVILPPVMKAPPNGKETGQDEEVKEAVQLVRIEYVLKDEQRVKRIQDQQTWRYDPESGQWRILSDFPGFE